MPRNPDKKYDKPPITPEQYNTIILALRTSSVSVDNACRAIHVSPQSFYNYKRDNPDAEEQYARAKSDQVDSLVDKIEFLHDECKKVLNTLKDNKLANAMVQFYKLQIDDYKWLASKLKPKKYGDRIEQTLKTEQPIQVMFNIPPIDTSKINASNQTTDNTTGSGGDTSKL